MKSVKKITLIMLLITCLNLTGCGFHFRNQNTLPSQLHTLYLQSDNPYGQFENTLKQNLSAIGVTFTQTPQQAPIILRLSRTSLTHTEPTLGSSNQARVYSFYFRVTFTLTNNKGKVLLPAQTVTSVQQLTLNAGQLLEANNQVNLLQQEIHRDAVRQIINRLSSTQAFEALKHENPSRTTTTATAKKSSTIVSSFGR